MSAAPPSGVRARAAGSRSTTKGPSSLTCPDRYSPVDTSRTTGHRIPLRGPPSGSVGHPRLSRTPKRRPAITSIYVISLTYIVDLTTVETQLEAHREFLRQHYETGVFLASG